MNNLALVLSVCNQGKDEQAEEIYRQVLKLMEKVLGKEHPDTLMSMFNLAYVLSNQKRFSEAEALYQRALNGYGKTLASDHPTTQACRYHYSCMLKEMQEDREKKEFCLKDRPETTPNHRGER
jgi:tetratricopeptide (TPR) repeat protein